MVVSTTCLGDGPKFSSIFLNLSKSSSVGYEKFNNSKFGSKPPADFLCLRLTLQNAACYRTVVLKLWYVFHWWVRLDAASNGTHAV